MWDNIWKGQTRHKLNISKQEENKKPEEKKKRLIHSARSEQQWEPQ